MKSTLQAACDEVEEFVRLNGRGGEIRTRDHAHGSHIPPQLREAVEQPSTSPAE